MILDNIIYKIPSLYGEYTFIQLYTKKDDRYHFGFSRVMDIEKLFAGFLEFTEVPIGRGEDQDFPLIETADYLLMGAGTAVKDENGVVLFDQENESHELRPNHCHAKKYKEHAGYSKKIFIGIGEELVEVVAFS
jgi:hypothetical protein